MTTSVRRWCAAIAVPIAVLLILGFGTHDLADAWLGLLTFAAFWAVLFLPIQSFVDRELDVTTYGGLLLFYMPAVAVVGTIWGLIGLALVSWAPPGAREFAGSGAYGGVSLLLAALYVVVPTLFRRSRRTPGPPGVVRDDRHMMESHAPPVVRGSASGGTRPANDASKET